MICNERRGRLPGGSSQKRPGYPRPRESGKAQIAGCGREKDKEKQAEIAKNRDILIEKVKELKPSVGVIICKANIYREVAESIRRAGINVLHNVPIPFPSNNGSKKPQFKTQRDEFVSSFRDIIKRCK